MSQAAVLKPYGSMRRMSLGWRLLLVIALVLLAAFYGMLTAVLPLTLIVIPAVPILAIGAFCLWLMPDIGGVYESTYSRLIVWCMAIHIVWPPYIALNLPGLPWISPMRIATGVLVLGFLFNLASSSEMRRTAYSSMMAVPAIGRLFWAYWALTAVTLVLSDQVSVSLTTFANNQIFWTMFFVLATMVARKPGLVSKAMTVAFIATLPSCIASILEYQAGKVIWIESLPRWLWADEELVSQLLVSVGRMNGALDYRVRGTTMNPLYYAEYLSMVFPCGIYLIWLAKGFARKLLIIAAMMLMIVAMYLTSSRTAMAGMLLSVVGVALLLGLRAKRDQPNSLMTTGFLAAYPAALIGLVVLVLSWRKAYVALIGGGQHNPSNLAREIQWQMGWDLLKSNPIGHGAGRGGETLGYANPAGTLTIDSYYLNVLLEYGVFALPLFVAMFSIPVYFAVRSTFRQYRDPELDWLLPIGVSLMNLMVIKTVNSTASNLPMAFLMLGFSVALIARMRAEDASPAQQRSLTRWEPAGAVQA